MTAAATKAPAHTKNQTRRGTAFRDTVGAGAVTADRSRSGGRSGGQAALHHAPPGRGGRDPHRWGRDDGGTSVAKHISSPCVPGRDDAATTGRLSRTGFSSWGERFCKAGSPEKRTNWGAQIPRPYSLVTIDNPSWPGRTLVALCHRWQRFRCPDPRSKPIDAKSGCRSTTSVEFRTELYRS